MNLNESMLQAINFNHNTGNTRALADACHLHDAILVVANEAYVADYKMRFNVEAMSVEAAANYRGNRPLLFDNEAIAWALTEEKRGC